MADDDLVEFGRRCLRAAARLRIRNPSLDADDVAQECVLAALRARARGADPGLRYVRRRVIDAARVQTGARTARWRARPALPLGAVAVGRPCRRLAAVEDRDEAAHLLGEFRRRLGRRGRWADIVALVVMGGRSQAEAAAAAGVSPPLVSLALRDARREAAAMGLRSA